MSLFFNISETKHVIKKLTTDIIITPKVLIESQKENVLPYPFKVGKFWPTRGLIGRHLRRYSLMPTSFSRATVEKVLYLCFPFMLKSDIVIVSAQ